MPNFIWNPPSADSKLGKSKKGDLVSLDDAQTAGIRAAWGNVDPLLVPPPASQREPAAPPAPIVNPAKKARAAAGKAGK